ncbi:MAG: ATP-grasp domain-containing protein [Woeseiaceae bacterium]
MANLILVHQDTKQDRADYEEIARRVDADVFIVDTKAGGIQDPRFDAGAPTLTVSPMPIKKFVPPRGAVCQGFEHPKSEQCARLAKLGLPVPKWKLIDEHTALHPDDWGPYVVVKPDLGRKGAEIFIKRTGRVRYRAPDFLAQQFIYTGRWPVSYRVVTLFGGTLMSWRCEADQRFVPLESRWDFKARGGITVVSNKKDSRYGLAFDRDVISLAEQAHAAFPGQPLLGTDIVRDADSGALYVIECNPRGDAWLISSVMGRMIEQANGLDFAAQFGALEVAARALSQETRARAA